MLTLPSRMPVVRFFDDMSEDTADALNGAVEPAATKAAALPAQKSPADEDPMVAAFLELSATPWSQEPARTEKRGFVAASRAHAATRPARSR